MHRWFKRAGTAIASASLVVVLAAAVIYALPPSSIDLPAQPGLMDRTGFLLGGLILAAVGVVGPLMTLLLLWQAPSASRGAAVGVLMGSVVTIGVGLFAVWAFHSEETFLTEAMRFFDPETGDPVAAADAWLRWLSGLGYALTALGVCLLTAGAAVFVTAPAPAGESALQE